MALDKLFTKPNQVLNNSSLDKLTENVESPDYVDYYLKERSRFLPPVDFSDPNNFAFYGSAEKYYRDSIQRIARTYPYDGSAKEKLVWQVSSSYLDIYTLKNDYPRTTGYAILSAGGWGTRVTGTQGFGQASTTEYIKVKGGPNLGPSGTYVGANILNLAKNQGSNLRFHPMTGSTVEFWLKKPAFDIAKTEKEIIFDLDNNQTTADNIAGRLRLTLTGSSASPFVVTYGYYTGSFADFKGILSQSIGDSLTTASLETWHHYAFVFQTTGSVTRARLFVDGVLNDTVTTGSEATASLEVTGALEANIGGLLSNYPVEITGATVAEGWAKLSASLDEFRYWKTARTDRDIARYWFTQVNGGVNTDSEASKDLGIYYKFNEGITTTASVDAVVLDYSGRLSNGAWTGYTSTSRNTGSAIVSASAADFEFLDPIVYEAHPDVQALLATKIATGSYYDTQNNSMMFRMFPDQMVDDDLDRGAGVLSNLTQILASYFDTAFLQIQALNTLKTTNYASGTDRPSVFGRHKVESLGLLTPDLFVDTTTLEQLVHRSETKNYEENLNAVKNTVYQNIYNNLAYMYKVKGTEQAFRNMVRCFGVDDAVVRLSVNTNNQRFTLQNNFREFAYKKRYLDFNNPDRFNATVYQYPDAGNANSVGFITGSTKETVMPWTVEARVLFPKKAGINTDVYFSTPFKTASICGMHSVRDGDTPLDTSWALVDAPTFTVQAIRDRVESPDASFKLNISTLTLTSSLYQDVYDNSDWTFAVRVSTDYPFGDKVTQVSGSDAHVEFQGVQTQGGSVVNQFLATGTLPAEKSGEFLVRHRRLFAGADRTNFTGSTVTRSDVKVGYLRAWLDYVDSEAVVLHARDVRSFGGYHPAFFSHVFDADVPNVEIPKFNGLFFNWDYQTNTGSDASGQFTVADFSSGTAGQNRYGWLSDLYDRQHTGRADFFPASSTASVDISYSLSSQQQLPETVQSEDMVSVLTRDDEVFVRDLRPQTYAYAFEKNMYSVISQEMLNYFGTIVDFNNLIGDPVNRFRQEYKALSHLRTLFFDRVNNTPDIERYIEYYKWLDSSLIKILRQFVPASADFSDALSTVVESHILERNKVRFPYGIVDEAEEVPIRAILGVNQGLYTWGTGHHPVTNSEEKNETYWKYRAKRDDPVLTSGDSALDSARESLRKIVDVTSPRIYTSAFKASGEK